MEKITIEDIKRAQETIKDIVKKTDILENVNKCSHSNKKLRREGKLNAF